MFVANEFSTLSSEQIFGFLFYARRLEYSLLETLQKIALFSQYFPPEKPPFFI